MSIIVSKLNRHRSMISIYDSANLLRAAIKNNDIRLASVQRSNAVSSQKTVLYRNHREDRVRVVARERKSRGEEMGKTKACSTIVRLMEKKKKNKKKEKKKKEREKGYSSLTRHVIPRTTRGNVMNSMSLTMRIL